MATLNTIRNVVSNYGGNAGSSPVFELITVTGTPDEFEITDVDTISSLSVGDTFVITDTTALDGYSTGAVYRVTSIDYAAAPVYMVTTQVSGTAAGVIAGLVAIEVALTNVDTDPVASVGGSSSSAVTHAFGMTSGDGTVASAIAGSTTVPLVSLLSVANPTNMELMIYVESATDSVTGDDVILSFQIFEDTLVGPAVLATMKAGDVFYTSSVSWAYWDGAAAATGVNPIYLQVENTSANAVNAVIRTVLGSKV